MESRTPRYDALDGAGFLVLAVVAFAVGGDAGARRSALAARR